MFDNSSVEYMVCVQLLYVDMKGQYILQQLVSKRKRRGGGGRERDRERCLITFGNSSASSNFSLFVYFWRSAILICNMFVMFQLL